MTRFFSALLFTLPFTVAAAVVEPFALMPRVGDYTLMYWADGFPSHSQEAPWRRVIQTGYYAFALDTDTLQVPHFGSLPAGPAYPAAVRADDRVWESLPAAELALLITANGKQYTHAGGGKWSLSGGPRLIDSGRFVQRADVTELTFLAADGSRLAAKVRFETVAWPDRLALILAATPGKLPLPAGEPCFGRVGGGFGLDGSNHLELPHGPELEPAKFTLELWAFVPSDYRVSEKTFPWLVCKNGNEEADGNYGLVILNGRLQARMNVGGGRENAFTVDASPKNPLRIDQWNHLAMSYDGDTMRLFVNGSAAGTTKIGRPRSFGKAGLAFGRRQDKVGDGYHFRGAIDEIRLYDDILTEVGIRERFLHPEVALAAAEPVFTASFANDGAQSLTRPTAIWKDAAMEIRFTHSAGARSEQWHLPAGEVWSGENERSLALTLDLPSLEKAPLCPVRASATEFVSGRSCQISYEADRGWHRVDLNGIEPVLPPGEPREKNDVLERVKLVLDNPSDKEQIARLLFEKTAGGIRQGIGAPITGISAILRETSGEPSGIPVQLSKNWHHRPGSGLYSGQWFHGFSQIRLPAGSTVELELTLAYGHWGGVAAASHAQLCLIGWGSHQLWDQSALGSWGESICYEPDQVQGECSILDVRPLMVSSMKDNAKWGWTHNVGGGDFFRFFDPSGKRIPHTGMRTAYQRHGPCLTEVTYAGRIGPAITHHETVSLTRSDDLVRGTYRIRLDVRAAADFSRLVLFQIGADTYSYASEQKMALGNETGLIKEWATKPGGEVYRTEPVAASGRVPWISLHEAIPHRKPAQEGAWPNRGLVIRSWKAILGGREAAPWIAERGVTARGTETSTIDLLPPPGLTRLEAGDYVEATIEHLIVPRRPADYYGPNEPLRSALEVDGDTWRMVEREAQGNDRQVDVTTGTLHQLYPAITIATVADKAAGTLRGGLGYVAITFTGLTSPRGHRLTLDGIPLDQSVHGADFWQTDFDPVPGHWSVTYNVAASTDGAPQSFVFKRER